MRGHTRGFRKCWVAVYCRWFLFHIALALCSNLSRVSLCHKQKPAMLICKVCWFCSEGTGWVWTCLVRPAHRCVSGFSNLSQTTERLTQAPRIPCSILIITKTFFINLNSKLRQIELEWLNKNFKKLRMKVSFIYSIPRRCWCSCPFSTPGSTRPNSGFCWPQNTDLRVCLEAGRMEMQR